nr:hypothetical protein [Tanacetum cinerariifolium]
MPPRRLRKKFVKKLVERRVAKAIEEYEKTRADSINAGKRGLRQGDPLSPYLFTLVIEILILILQRRVRDSDEFQYHYLCEQQRVINLCFADDLFLFFLGNPTSVAVIMDALEEFKQVSGLVPNIPKSTTFFCNVPNAIKASILNSTPFAEGVLPVRYLGVPLISSRLLYRDCKILVKNLKSIANDWRNKFLSLAGRLQLIRFLWCQGEMKNGKAKVAWDSVCILKHEGGLEVMLAGDGASFSKLDSPSNLLFGTKLTMGYYSIGFSLDDSVNNLISDGVWRWPIDWLSRDGVLRPFSVACAWDKIRTRADIVNWLRQWDVGPSIDLNLLRCLLCDLVPDSHDHLFFECAFSSHVWSKLRVLCGMDTIPPRLIDITTFITPISKGK